MKLKSKGYEVIACDVNAADNNVMTVEGIQTFTSIEDFTLSLKSKRVIWLMIPPGDLVDQTLQELKFRLAVSDIIIDGSNSFYKDTIRRAKEMEALQIDYLDCGLSETEDLHQNVFATIGGNRFAFNYCEKIFKDVAAQDGYLYCGTSGSGHFVQMIHTKIEHGLIQTIAEEIEAIPEDEFKLNPTARSWLMEKASGIRK